MATLVLTAVGSAIGGPVGGAIGSIIGQQIDRAIFAPKPREGARLKELEVQTSSYGTQIPAVFGTMRVAGTVIWATDLIERRVKSGGGKGRPSTVNYSYSVSMAVALSSRPVLRVGRIWADGNLLRGAGGDFKVDTQFRFHSGHADQPLDPLMASAEAAGQCPAHRGLAYAVFENLQLADYGNRIPSLTFEIFERDEVVPVDDIFGAASDGAVVGGSDEAVIGFALAGDNARNALAPLLAALPIELAVRDGALAVGDMGVVPAIVPTVTAAATENNQHFDAPRQSFEPAANFPQSVSLRYYDKARDFQAGVQQSQHGNRVRNAMQIEFPAVIDAADARRIVEMKHLRALCERAAWSGDALLSTNRLAPGDWFSGANGRAWRIEEIEHRFGSATIKARAVVSTATSQAGTVIPGRNLPSPDVIAGQTWLAIIDLPVFDTNDPGKAQIAIFAAGTGSGWRRAALSLPGDTGLLDIGPTAPPAIMGVSLNILAPHTGHLIDETAQLDVELLNSAMDIAERSGSPLDRDARTICLGGEFIRYGNCAALGNRRYRLSRLLRGCFEAEQSGALHPVGTPFVLLDVGTARLITERDYTRGDMVTVEALGIGDAGPVSATAIVDAAAITPPPPVHGVAEKRQDGSIVATWIRRSRIDFGWRDGVDQALVEEGEQYLVSLHADMTPVGEWVSHDATITIDTAILASMNLPVIATLSLAVRQTGLHAQSDPLVIPIP